MRPIRETFDRRNHPGWQRLVSEPKDLIALIPGQPFPACDNREPKAERSPRRGKTTLYRLAQST